MFFFYNSMDKKKKPKINLQKDELPHENCTVEWWYFNGFMNSKKRKYAFMNCLFRTNLKKSINLLKIPLQDFYFSHNILYDLSSGKIKKEIIPFVILSPKSFEKNLFVEYYCPIFKNYGIHKIFRKGKNIFLQNDYYQVSLMESKNPLYENGTGFINLGEKSTYYYSYTNLKLIGKIGSEIVTGKAWYDRQWSRQGATNDSWLWFSLQLPDNTEIVCFDYKGKKLANIIYENGQQETCKVNFKPIGEEWTNPRTKISYNLEWEIKIRNSIIGNLTFKTRPFIKDCEVSFGSIHYWEGPVKVSFNGKRALGFMEYVLKPISKGVIDIIYKNEVAAFFDFIKDKFKSIRFHKLVKKSLS